MLQFPHMHWSLYVHVCVIVFLSKCVVDVGKRRFVRLLVERGTCVGKVIVDSLCAGKEVVNCLLDTNLGYW